MSTETIAPPVTETPLVVPPNNAMSQAAIGKLFPSEVKEVPAQESKAPATEKIVETSVPKKEDQQKSFLKTVTENQEPVKQAENKKAESTPSEKPRSKTALEIDNMKAEHAAKLQEISTQRDEMKARAFDLENELNELREKASTLADYEEIKKKNKQYEEVITRLDIQELPEFKQKYTIQEQEIFSRVEGILDGVENKDKIISALKMSPGAEREAKLDELKQDLGITKVSKLAAYEARLDELGANRKLEIDNAAIAKRLYMEDQARRDGEQKTQQEKIFDKYAHYFSENDPTYKKRDGDEAFNQNVDQRLSKARDLYFKASPEERAEAMLAAVDRPILMSLVKKLSEELATAQGALNGKLEATPGVGATRKDEPTKPTSAIEAFKQAISS